MKLSAPPVVNHYEIERRVAVEVMGLPDLPFHPNTPCPYCRKLGRYCGTRSWCCDCQEWYYHPYKNYRDSLDDAMEVVEKMRERGLQVSIRSWEGAVPWSVKFISYTSKEEVEADGDNLPEAICNAGLAAVGKE